MHSKWIAGQPVCPVPAQPSGGRSAAQVEVGGVAGKSVVTSPLYKTILSFNIELSYVKKNLAYFLRASADRRTSESMDYGRQMKEEVQ